MARHILEIKSSFKVRGGKGILVLVIVGALKILGNE